MESTPALPWGPTLWEGALSQQKDGTASSWARGRANSLPCLRQDGCLGLGPGAPERDFSKKTKPGKTVTSEFPGRQGHHQPPGFRLSSRGCAQVAHIPPVPPGSAPQPQPLGLALPLVP